ncbi:AB hydrolase superfamily protein [Pleurotus pulmonarius]
MGDAIDMPTSTLVERSIARGQPVIVVIPNYRINALGFLAGSEILEAGSALHLSGYRTAVRISEATPRKSPFGPLFHATFMESGGPLQVPKVSDGQKDYDSIVDSVGCTHRQDTLACLRTVPLDTLAAAINETRDIFSFSSLNLAWIPRIDGDLIKEGPYTLIRRSAYARATVMTKEHKLFPLSTINITTTPEFLDYIGSNHSATSLLQRLSNYNESRTCTRMILVRARRSIEAPPTR